MTFTSAITKEDMSKLPREEFRGRIVVANTRESVDKAVSYLSSFSEIGFDTETRPNFTKDSHHKTALVQLSCNDACFLIRLNKFRKMPWSLKSILANKQIKKIGLALHDDLQGLYKLAKLSPENFIDLQQYVSQFGIEDMSLQKIYAILFGKKISKGKQRSNWEAEALTEPQLKYAALDAWACLRIYQFLEQSK